MNMIVRASTFLLYFFFHPLVPHPFLLLTLECDFYVAVGGLWVVLIVCAGDNSNDANQIK